ncbi:hypothetical protein Baya_2124 [Bagarius yarrelli]|uniref:Uncharacterized protein n=1 Tax=Bagarius yarrelli TaxID=175774 RepID=A0A556TN22_BAGYA|nr:hypothetical protein Baya_2124 [Bagarius yarrelli]
MHELGARNLYGHCPPLWRHGGEKYLHGIELRFKICKRHASSFLYLGAEYSGYFTKCQAIQTQLHRDSEKEIVLKTKKQEKDEVIAQKDDLANWQPEGVDSAHSSHTARALTRGMKILDLIKEFKLEAALTRQGGCPVSQCDLLEDKKNGLAMLELIRIWLLSGKGKGRL